MSSPARRDKIKATPEYVRNALDLLWGMTRLTGQVNTEIYESKKGVIEINFLNVQVDRGNAEILFNIFKKYNNLFFENGLRVISIKGVYLFPESGLSSRKETEMGASDGDASADLPRDLRQIPRSSDSDPGLGGERSTGLRSGRDVTETPESGSHGGGGSGGSSGEVEEPHHEADSHMELVMSEGTGVSASLARMYHEDGRRCRLDAVSEVDGEECASEESTPSVILKIDDQNEHTSKLPTMPTSFTRQADATELRIASATYIESEVGQETTGWQTARERVAVIARSASSGEGAAHEQPSSSPVVARGDAASDSSGGVQLGGGLVVGTATMSIAGLSQSRALPAASRSGVSDHAEIAGDIDHSGCCSVQ